jgi:ABC-type transport system involved in multi-copper enzyme maturation permease subunit
MIREGHILNGLSSLATVKELIGDTFRQAWASGILWMMLAGTATCVLLCLSVQVSGSADLYGEDEPGMFLPPLAPRTVAPAVVAVLGSPGPLEALTTAGASQRTLFGLETDPEQARREGIETISGRLTLAFGAVSVPLGRERSDAVHFLELILAAGIGGTFGLLLALVWTAGFTPTFLEPSAASVLLAKPAPRWQLLVGKYVGVLTFVAFQVILFVALTRLALGVRTNVWDTAYWWCVPLLLVQFAVFYSFSVLLAVVTRSTVACVFGSLLFWLLAWGTNYGTVMARSPSESQYLPAFTRTLTEAAYWISPKPIDAGLMLFNALNAQHHFEKPVIFQLLESGPGFSPLLSILSSLAIAGVLLALSIYEFNATDY